LVVVITLGDSIDVIGMELAAQEKILNAGVPAFATVKLPSLPSVKWPGTGNSDVHSKPVLVL